MMFTCGNKQREAALAQSRFVSAPELRSIVFRSSRSLVYYEGLRS